MKNSKFLAIILTLALLTGLLALPGAALALTAPSLTAPHALLLDAGSGAVLYEKDADARISPASTTKIMTALLAVEAVERGEAAPDEAVTAPAAAMAGLDALGSTAGIRAGETMTLRQLLDCMMLASANEAANVIACHLSGSVEAFARAMNARAEALGCTGTHFANPHGLTDSAHYTTVRDMGLIAREAMRHALFVEICSAAAAEVPATNLSGARQLHNSNALLSGSGIYGGSWLYEGAEGVKTGHTSAAGYCLVSAAGRGGMKLLGFIFGADSSDSCFRDTAALLNWGFANHSLRALVRADETVASVTVRCGDLLDTVDLHPAEDFLLLLPNDCALGDVEREITIFGDDGSGTVTGPVPSGAPLGYMVLTANGETYGGVDLIPASSSALILDRKSGEVLYGKGLDSRVYPADTVKLMTALLAIESVETGKHSYNDMVTVSEAIDLDLGEDATRCGLSIGEQLTLQSLLECVLVASGDDAANLLAEFIGGTVPAFVADMNARAAALGCADTAFTNPHGGWSEGQYTTARDFSRIALECMKHERLRRICGTVIAELPETNLTAARTLKNTNALLCDESPYGASYVYEGADGLKAGYNARSGYALAATAERSGMELLCCIFGGSVGDDGLCTTFTDASTLFDWVFNNYSYQEVLKSTENIASVDVALGMDAGYVNLRPATSVTVLLPNDYDPAAFQKDIRVYALENHETVTAPVSAGQVLGEVSVSRDGRVYGTVKLVASSSVELSRIQYIRQQVAQTLRQRSVRIAIIVLGLLFAAYLVWVVLYRVKHLRHVRAVRAAERERLLRTEAVMRHAEAPRSPGIRFFNARGETAPAEPPETEAAPEAAKPTPRPRRAEIDVPIDGEDEASADAAPDKVVTLFPGAAKAPEAAGDLLDGATLVARIEPKGAARTETEAEKAERDYFEEFFRPKK